MLTQLTHIELPASIEFDAAPICHGPHTRGYAPEIVSVVVYLPDGREVAVPLERWPEEEEEERARFVREAAEALNAR